MTETQNRPPESQGIAITEETRFQAHEDLSWREIEGQMVCMNLKSGEYFTFNGVGREIWQAVADERGNTRDIVAKIVSEYAVEESVAQKDSKEFLRNLLEAGLIRPVDSQQN